MIASTKVHDIIHGSGSGYVPALAKIIAVREETYDTTTYTLKLTDPQHREQYRFEPGQFNMLYIFGIGECAISISSCTKRSRHLQHTIRHVGNVTEAIRRMKVDQVIGIRGPYGTSWPLEKLKGRDLVLVSGGIGLAPLRPVIYHIMNNRSDYGRVVLLYGSRSPRDLLYTDELEAWNEDHLAEVLITVDHATEQWDGPVGVVTDLLKRVKMSVHNTSVLVCGPRIMNRVATFRFLQKHVAPEQIFISLERNMKCGFGQCGHCQYGSRFVCKDGPIFSFDQVAEFFGKDEV